MEKLTAICAIFLLAALLCACAGQHVEVRPRGEISVGVGVGNR